jgi:DnaJ-class molecular chaperone
MIIPNIPARKPAAHPSAATQTTLYDALEVSPRASAQVIHAAYRCLAQSSHPDKHRGAAAAEHRMATINHAYAVLSDPAARQRYDRQLATPERMVERRGGNSAHRGFSRTAETVQQVSRAFAFRPL